MTLISYCISTTQLVSSRCECYYQFVWPHLKSVFEQCLKFLDRKRKLTQYHAYRFLPISNAFPTFLLTLLDRYLLVTVTHINMCGSFHALDVSSSQIWHYTTCMTPKTFMPVCISRFWLSWCDYYRERPSVGICLVSPTLQVTGYREKLQLFLIILRRTSSLCRGRSSLKLNLKAAKIYHQDWLDNLALVLLLVLWAPIKTDLSRSEEMDYSTSLRLQNFTGMP